MFNSWALEFRKSSTHDNFEKQTLTLDIQKSTRHDKFKKDYHTYLTHNLVNYSTLSSLRTTVAAAKHIYIHILTFHQGNSSFGYDSNYDKKIQ